MHENLERRENIRVSSDRSFGLVMGAGFALVALLPLLHAPHRARWWAMAIAFAFAVIALLSPKWLAPLNRLWLRFGLLLSAIVSPIILGLLFYTTILPIGLVMRIFGKDPLRLRPDRAGRSYWISCDRSAASDMRHQF